MQHAKNYTQNFPVKNLLRYFNPVTAKNLVENAFESLKNYHCVVGIGIVDFLTRNKKMV